MCLQLLHELVVTAHFEFPPSPPLPAASEYHLSLSLDMMYISQYSGFKLKELTNCDLFKWIRLTRVNKPLFQHLSPFLYDLGGECS